MNYLTYLNYFYCYNNPIFNYYKVRFFMATKLNNDWTQKIEFWDCYFPCALKTIHLNGKHIVDVPNLDQRTIKGFSIEFAPSEDEDDEEFPYWIVFQFFGNMSTYYPFKYNFLHSNYNRNV